MVRQEKEATESSAISTSAAIINGNGVLPKIPNGKPKVQAREGRRQVMETDGVEILEAETREVIEDVPRRRSTRSRSRKAA